MTRSILGAVVCLMISASTSFAQDGVDIVGSDITQYARGLYLQSLRGGGEQDLRVNEISGDLEIRGRTVRQYLDANVVQHLQGSGPQRTYLNRLVGKSR